MTRRSIILLAALTALAGLRGWSAEGSEPLFQGAAGTYTQLLDCEQKPKAFDPYTIVVPVALTEPIPGGEQMIRCVTRTADGGVGQKGVKVTLEGTFFDLDGDPRGTIPRETRRTDRDGYVVHELELLQTLIDQEVLALIDAEIAGGRRKAFSSLETSCSYLDRLPCQNGPETLCLLDDDRFRVEVDWRGPNQQSGQGMVLTSGPDEGVFYFVDPNFPDLVVQLLDRCSFNDHFWVFAAATTSVEYEVRVTDTVTGAERTYGNDLASPNEAITDTAAFATCP